MTNFLERLKSPGDLKCLSLGELKQLAAEIRERIVETVSRNGGHLASSLGVVELTIALHRVLETPRDQIVWDVGHQAYAHKLLTGRLDRFDTLRRLNGISGFPRRSESPYDSFGAGHASTSISAALGMAAARDTMGGSEKVVAVIGDGSLTGGLAFEGLNQAGALKKDLIVVLNDNEMSISPNVGALASFLSRKMTSERFVRFRTGTKLLLGRIPRFGPGLLGIVQRAEGSLKGFLTPGKLFEAFGFEYVGPLDGHSLEDLIETLENVKRLKGPVLLHVLTKKGKGYPFAEESPALFHGVGPFDRATGMVKPSRERADTYTTVFGNTLVEMAEKDERIVAITAAMTDGTGLTEFARRFPGRFYDVGIAEQHAVTFAAGLSCRGLRPVVAIYSTFLQRAYDNILSDVCLQNLPIAFALDRGGLVGEDGPTHHGAFDLSFLRPMPNLAFMVPRNEEELRRAMVTAISHDGPFMFRYPRARSEGLPLNGTPEPVPIGRGETLRGGVDGVIFAVGSMIREALAAAERLEMEGIRLGVVDPRFVKPLDRELLVGAARRAALVVTVEENVLQGGFGSAVMELLEEEGLMARMLRIGLPDRYIEHGSRSELHAACGLDADGIARRIRKVVGADTPVACTPRARFTRG
ncbi:1-deoxy-D-xylulose-5-phosphate synthase [Candidatus Deferrimicrobium sp.]|uniref:1-deoxy-D-xylulose-5-phosphate synthase n=1 Tax=Candidatus Deferrimicrobium sp. TaxID=3060586 RepID=UPI002ED6B971